ncbi:MAG: tetratricopeptide repeat protein [Paracoccaceae bacterium]
MELTLDQALQKGIEAHKAGKVQEADRYYTAIIKANPKHPDANHNMGVLAVGIGKVEEALLFFKTALEANSSITQFWLSYIDALVKLDRMIDAKAVFDKAKSKGAKGDAFDQIKKRLSNEAESDSNQTDNQRIVKAIDLRESGKYDEAIDLLLHQIKKSPTDPNIPLMLSHCYILNDDLKEAIINLEKAKRLNPNKPSVGWNETRILLKQKKVDEALVVAKKTNELFPDDVEGMGVLGACFRANGRFNESLKYLGKAIQLNPNYAEAYINRGLISLVQKNKLNALSDLEKAYHLKSHIKQIWYIILNLKMEAKEFEATISIAEEMIKIDPTDERIFFSIALCHQNLNKYDQAVVFYKKVLIIKSDNAEAYKNMSIVLKKQGKLEEAIEACNKALLIKPDYAEAYNNMGNILIDQGKLDKALEAFENALSIKPDYAPAYNNMGNVLKDQGKLDKALEAFENALSIKPDYAPAYNNMGNVLKDQGKFEEAIEAYKKTLLLKPNYAEAYRNLGNVLKDQGKLEEAIEAYKKTLLLKPNYAEAYRNLGIALNDQGKLDEGVSNFQKAFAIRSNIVPKGDDTLAPATTGLFFELTNKCNFHCVFCPSDSQKRNLGSMNLELVKRLYTEASEKKLAKTINLHLMGEPTLHPQLIEILDFGASKNIKTDLVTNGSTLVGKIVPKILGSLYGTITASHMTPTKETYHFRGKVGLSWERYISNLRLLVREYMKRIAQKKICKNDIIIRVMSTMNTAANCTITKTTKEAHAIFKEWSDFVASIEEELGMDRFDRMSCNAHDLLKGNESPSVSYQLQKGIKLSFWRAFTFANTRVSDEYEIVDRKETAYCPHPFTDVGVLWNGDVTLCCFDHDGELSVGNINASSIEEIIQNDAAKKLRASMLGRCSLPSICQICQAKPIKLKGSNKLNPAIA